MNENIESKMYRRFSRHILQLRWISLVAKMFLFRSIVCDAEGKKLLSRFWQTLFVNFNQICRFHAKKCSRHRAHSPTKSQSHYKCSTVKFIMDKSKIASVFILWGKVLLQKNHYASKREREKNNKCFLQKKKKKRTKSLEKCSQLW